MIGAATLIGRKLGAYELQELLSHGGMSSVYRGFDERLRRSVAIKVLAEAVAAQPGFAARFRQEALLIASLHHPHIVQIYDFGEQDGLTYMVQELLPGPTLEQRLNELRSRGERLDRQEILAIVSQLASALDAAHAAGIIHRDVKPGNALWNGAGALVLTDFGIAKNTLDQTSQTQAGLVFGTPNYLSPEQAQGLPLAPASDIYGLGVVLYELIAGRPPFSAGTSMGVVMDHLYTPPPPLRPLRPELPPAAEAVVLRVLAKKPEERFGSAGELARALERAWPPHAGPTTGAPAEVVRGSTTPIWEQPTTASKAPPALSPARSPARKAPPAPSPARSPAQPSPRRGPGPLLIVLGAVLGLLLLGAAAALLRGAGTPGSTAPGIVATEAAQPTALPILATAAPPEPQPSPIPPATAAPDTAQPSPAPEPADPIEQLRVLLEAGGADGRAGKDADKLLSTLKQVQQALSKGDEQRAANRLEDMRQRVQEGVGADRIAPDFAQQVLASIDAIASQHGLHLSAAGAGGKDKKGKG